MKKAPIYITALAIMVAGVSFFPDSVSAANLGGVSVYNACKNQYPHAYHWEVFILSNSYNVMGWRCHLNHITSGSVQMNLNTQCEKQYRKGAKAKYTNFNDPFSWYCEG